MRFRALRSCRFIGRGRSYLVSAEEHATNAETLLYMLHASDPTRTLVK